MPVELSATMDQVGAREIINAIRRDAKYTGGTLGKSLSWGGRKICESMGRITPAMKRGTLREIVHNPDERWKRDARRAPYGVMKLFQDKPPKFIPIYRTGEYGSVRYFGLDNGTWLVRKNKTSWEHRPASEYSSNMNIAMKSPNVKTNPKRKIARAGFAKKSWRYLQMRTARGGYIIVDGIPRMGEVVVSGGSADPTLRITNRVSYVSKILTGSIDSAMAAAARGMIGQIERGIRKRMKTT
jgi:hypothetical protein